MKGIRRRDSETRQRKFGDQREAGIVKRGGYAHTPGSGSSSVKGDLRRGDFMVEVKATRHDSFRVTADIMGKLRNDGLTNGRPGALIVEIGTGEHFVVMPLKTFEKLVPEND